MKLGYGFADNIRFSQKKPKTKGGFFQEKAPSSSRLPGFYLILLGAFFILVSRLFYLQILEGGKLRQVSEENRVRVKTLPAPRGVIADRNGEVLVRNIPGYRLKIEGDPSLFKTISREEALQIEAKGGTEAASLEVDILREYLYPQILAHVLGYTSEITQEQLKEIAEIQNYQLGDRVGQAGIEKQYQEILKGKKGNQFLEVDAQEKRLGLLKEIPPESGQNLTLTLDLRLQKKAFEALEGKKGTVVVSDPGSGEILALVSAPSFSPNIFTLGENDEEIGRLLNDEEEKPLFNRAISGLYPPGSTFKIITAAAGLEEGKISPKTQVEDVGVMTVGPYRFPNWFFSQYGKTEGNIDIVRAIARSNDIFFYKTAEWVGEKVLGEWAKKFGLGQKLGIDLEGESEGLVPTDEWKRANVGDKWYLGDTYHLGIGQGYILTTPLQVNAWTSVIANGGTLYQPHLVKSEKLKVKSQNFLKGETVELIKEGMREACGPGGTGWPLFNFKLQMSNVKFQIDGRNFLDGGEGWVEIPVACKTGTAEYGDPKGKTHAWFTVFAPVENPEIVVTVLVEGGGEGSSVAAPIAKEILEEYSRR